MILIEYTYPDVAIEKELRMQYGTLLYMVEMVNQPRTSVSYLIYLIQIPEIYKMAVSSFDFRDMVAMLQLIDVFKAWCIVFLGTWFGIVSNLMMEPIKMGIEFML